MLNNKARLRPSLFVKREEKTVTFYSFIVGFVVCNKKRNASWIKLEAKVRFKYMKYFSKMKILSKNEIIPTILKNSVQRFFLLSFSVPLALGQLKCIISSLYGT